MYVVDLYVTYILRTLGIGTALMNQVKSIGYDFGAAQVVWPVHKLNGTAQRFYERLGAGPLMDQYCMGLPVD